MSRSRGSFGEGVASRHLEQAGYRVLARNYRDGPREIDLIVRKGGLVAFVEVKWRADARHGHPFEAVGRSKRRDVERAARRWIAELGAGGVVYRFDVVGITGIPPKLQVFHLEDAWRVGE